MTDTRKDEAKTAGTAAGGRRPNVLVMDDDPVLLGLMCRSLHAAGCATVAAESVAAARSAVAAAGDGFDLLVFDLVLPDGRGTQLAQELCAARIRPVLIVSGDPNAPSEARAASPDFAFLRKPFLVREFARITRDLLSPPQAG